MLDLEPIEIKGKTIAPREFLLAVLQPKLLPQKGDTDVCVMWNTVRGRKDGKHYSVDSYLWDETDTENDISSMAQVTGFSAAIGALLIDRGTIKAKGIVPPEECFTGDAYRSFMEEIKKHGIEILETITEIGE